MRSLFLLFLFLCQGLMGNTQVVPVRPKMISNPNPNPTRWNLNILFTDVQGRPFANLYQGIEGSAYLFPEFKRAQLETRTGKFFDSVNVSLDLYHHELHMIWQGKEMVAQDGLVHWLSIRDTINGTLTECIFQSGFPPIEKNPSTHFYQVLTAGTYSLLLYRKMVLEKTTDVMSGLTQERFVPVEQLYVYDGKSIRRFQRDLSFLEQLFQDRLVLFRDYWRSYKINMRNRDQLIQLFEAMNGAAKKSF